MSKTIGANLKAHMALEVTTLAICWKVVRQDTQEFFFTGHDQDIIYDGDTYLASTGFTPSGIEQKANLSVDGLDVLSFLDAASITEADIHAGLFDYATVDIFMINYSDTTMGILTLAGGWILGEIRVQDSVFVAEVRSKSQLLRTQIVEKYSPECRAEFCDARCKLVAATYTVTGTLTVVTDNRIFTDTSRTEATDVFAYGKITWTGGNNNGYSMEVKDFDPGTDTLTLFEAMPREVQVGDTYSLIKGCNKRKVTCILYGNLVNFRGEPYLPGYDQVLQYPTR